MTTPRTYYVLAVHNSAYGEPDNGTGWEVAFGDYDLRTVTFERDDVLDHGASRKKVAILKTLDRQADIDAAIARLNAADPNYAPHD